jgi:putative molybdopterin biosynthesis protein
MKRPNPYIRNEDLHEAKQHYLEELSLVPGREWVPVTEALGRVNCSPVFARRSSPSFNSSAMDGIAVRSAETKAARPQDPLALDENEDFVFINTGNPLPEEYDAVVMIEEVIQLDDQRVQIQKPATPWQHVRLIGEDIVETEMILPHDHCIRPIDLGSLIAGGIQKLEVYKRPTVGILPTGSEIVSASEEPEFGKIVDTNSAMVRAMCEELGADVEIHAPVADDRELLRDTISDMVAACDVILILAGSSAGTDDYTKAVLSDLGIVSSHGIAIRPGKPTILGKIDEKPVIGLPGYPVSCFISFEEFVQPILEALQRLKPRNENYLQAKLTKNLVSSLKHTEFVRVRLGKIHGEWLATPFRRGAGSTMSLVQADGIGIIPRRTEGIAQGDYLRVRLMKDSDEIEKKLIVTGSHDLSLDILSDFLPVNSTHVGSMGGIPAMLNEEAHLAPIHLLDTEDGLYNRYILHQYFPEGKVVLIKGLKRQQGLIVQKGNPNAIQSLEDIRDKGLTYVNRQKGAGTRVLLDYLLDKEGIDKSTIKGYDKEMTTHMAVAQAVKAGNADAGMGAFSAAKSLGLDFIPVTWEDYDFLVPRDLLNTEQVHDFLSVFTSRAFQDRVLALGGYAFENPGQIITD